jgi:adenine deaminase
VAVWAVKGPEIEVATSRPSAMDGPRAVALAEAPADLVIENGRVLIPETRELHPRDVAVTDGEIAALPDDAGGVIGAETTV